MQSSCFSSISTYCPFESKIPAPKPKNKFTPEEDELLLSLAVKYKGKKWKEVSSHFANKSYIQCFSRYKRIRPGIKRGAWSPDEDRKIYAAVLKYGRAWAKIAKIIKTRNGKQVRDRYINVLDPEINKGFFTLYEDEAIMRYYAIYGSQWAKIAKQCGTKRSPDMIKNRYYSHLRGKIAKFLKMKEKLEELSADNFYTCDINESSCCGLDDSDSFSKTNPSILIDEGDYDETRHKAIYFYNELLL